MEFLDRMKAERKKWKKARKQKKKEQAKTRDLPDFGGAASSDEASAYDSKVEDGIAGTVIMFSGCQDSQTSADVHDVASFGLPDAEGAGGACTQSLLKSIEEGEATSWMATLKAMRAILATKRFTQIPQLSTSRRVNLHDPFTVKVGDGKTKALLIGINYVGQQGELAGCHNDVIGMRQFLVEHGYEEDRIKVLLDDGAHEPPTHDAILAGFDWLSEDAEAGDSLFCHYSGHGGSVRDDDGDEGDGYDETLVPLDYQAAGQIRDDVIFGRLVAPVPRGAHLTVLIDACHSGTVLDLPYVFQGTDDALVAAEEAEPDAATVQPNASFDMSFLMALAKQLFAMKQGGATNAELCTYLGKALGMG